MKHIRRAAFIILALLTVSMLSGCGCDLTGRWTEYKTESYVLENDGWVYDSQWNIGDDDRSPTIAEFTDEGVFRLDGGECLYEIEDSYLRLYQNGYLETDLLFIDSDRMVIQARYDDELKVIYFSRKH